VIDPDMSDELRVTVVATGLGEMGQIKAVQPMVEDVAPVRLVNSDVIEPAPSDYREMDTPTVVRKAAKSYVDAAQEKNMDYLDIPAFLRRQAD